MCSLRYKNGVPIVNWHLKNLLFVFNFLSWLLGLLMICIALYAKVDKAYSSSSDISGLLIDPVTPILMIGSAIFFITFFGCVGPLRENLCMLRFYSIALVVVLILELIAAFSTFAMSEFIRFHIEKTMNESVVHYRDDPDLQNIVDWGQESFKCCGVHTLNDWSNNTYFNCTDDNPSMERCGVPYSCCVPPDDDVVNTLCGINIQNLYYFGINLDAVVFTQGCLDAFVDWLHLNMFLLACLLMTFGCIPQILGILLTRILIIQVKDQYFYTQIGLLNARGEFDWFS